MENIQLLYLKTAHGFTGIEELLHVISQTAGQIFWVVTSTIYSWQFLERAIGIQKYFQHCISLEKMSANELRDVILKRHRASGYHLEFESANTTTSRRIFRGNSPESSYTQSAVLRASLDLYRCFSCYD